MISQMPQQREKLHYLIYCRKSSEAEDRQVESIADQLKVVTDIKLQKSLSVKDKPFTEARSAKKPGRPEFDRLIEEIDRRDDVKGIICWKLNRLFRNPEDEGKIRQRLSDGRILEIVTPTQIYKEIDSDFTMAVEGAQAQRFIRDLKEDTARGVNSKLNKGIAPILAPPGYKNDTAKRQGERDILPHPIQFSLVRKLLELYMTGNFSVQQLYDEAIKLGVRSNRDKIVSRTQIYQMLRNPFYTGIRFIYAGKLYTNGIHKRMLTDAEFDLIQGILDGRSHPRGQVHTDLLTGLLKCGECGRSITSEVKIKQYKNGNSQTFIYYRCTKKFRAAKCAQPYIRAEHLEAQVLDYLDQIQLSEKFVAWAIKWLQVMHEKQGELREAKWKVTDGAYQEVVKKIERCVELTISGMITMEDGKRRKQDLELEREKLADELNKLDRHVSEWSALAINTFDFVKNIKDKFQNGSIDQKKTILRVIGSNLVLKNKQLTIEIRTPFTYISKVVSELKDEKVEEPNDYPDISAQSAFLHTQNVKVGDVPDSNRRPSVPQTDALTN